MIANSKHCSNYVILNPGLVLQFIHTLKQVVLAPCSPFKPFFALIGCCSQTEGLNSIWAGLIKDNSLSHIEPRAKGRRSKDVHSAAELLKFCIF